ncbi:MAG: hypothetical protein H3C34_16280 [Caldilineaceae bacterium]|nr:hypothetical protein [Caldilineaceae bacterium]
MSSNLSPEKRRQIAEEQRIRNQVTMKAGMKLWLKMLFIIMGIVIALTVCYLVFLASMFGNVLSL